MKTNGKITSTTIMLVDDDEDDQELFVEALKEIKGFSLYGIASDGLEAINKLEHQSTKPDYIFMDINMPKMNGMQCLKELKQRFEVKDIPVFMLSSATDQSELALATGASAFLKKSADYQTLHNDIEKVIRAYEASHPHTGCA